MNYIWQFCKQGVQAQTVSNFYQAFANDLGNEPIFLSYKSKWLQCE